MSFRHVVLGALALGAAHGYRVWQRISALPGAPRRPETSHVYAALAALEREGLVAVCREPAKSRAGLRRHRLTSRGAAELDRWLAWPVAAAQRLDRALLARVAMVGEGGAAERGGLVADQAARRRTLERLRAVSPVAAEPALARSAREGTIRRLEIEVELLAYVLPQSAPASHVR